MQFEIESTGVTHRLSVGVASPQCCCAGVTVGTQCAGPLADNLKQREEIIFCNNLSFDEYNTNEYSHPEKCVTVCVSGSYQSLLGSDQWSVLAVHLVVQSTGVTQVVACAIPAPQRGSGGSTVNTLSGLCLELENTHLSLTMYHFVNRYKIVSVHLT